MVKCGWSDLTHTSVTQDKWKWSISGKTKIKYAAEYNTNRELW